jgi:hypothetical protein
LEYDGRLKIRSTRNELNRVQGQVVKVSIGKLYEQHAENQQHATSKVFHCSDKTRQLEVDFTEYDSAHGLLFKRVSIGPGNFGERNISDQDILLTNRNFSLCNGRIELLVDTMSIVGPDISSTLD